MVDIIQMVLEDAKKSGIYTAQRKLNISIHIRMESFNNQKLVTNVQTGVRVNIKLSFAVLSMNLNGGNAIGAFSKGKLVGFGVLAHAFRGEEQEKLQIDLMYVTREYRTQGIVSKIIDELGSLLSKKYISN